MSSWPTDLYGPKVDVTMDAAVSAGTTQTAPGGGRRPGRGGRSKYTATARWGLVVNGNSYKVVQLWYKLQPSTFTSYRQVKDAGGNHMSVYAEGCSKESFKRVAQADLPNMFFATVNGEPISDTTGLYCSKKKLYEPFQVTRTHPVPDYSAKYYRDYGGHFYVYRSTYATKIQSAAASWKNAIKYGDGADIPAIYSTALNPAALSAQADAIFSTMQKQLDADPEWLASRNIPINRLPNGMPKWGNLRDLVQTVLSKNGWPESQITAFLVSKGVKINTYTPVRGGGNTGGGGGHSNPVNNPPKPPVAPTPAVTKVVVRAPYGFAKPATKAPDNRPQIVQNYTTYVKDSSAPEGIKAVKGQDIFVFPYTPNNISYSGLGSKWDSIDRQGNFPIVEWSSWDLMRCEMEFLVAEDRTEGTTQVPDGLFVSVQDRLNTLRRMSQRQAAVSVFNLDDLFRVQVKRAKETGKALQFVIADLSFTSTRRSIDSVEKEITAASVKLTLQEIPIEKVNLVKMSPPIMSTPIIPARSTPGDEPPSDALFDQGLRMTK